MSRRAWAISHAAVVLAGMATCHGWASGEPPALPVGLGSGTGLEAREPVLPQGLSGTPDDTGSIANDSMALPEEETGVDLSGFWSTRLGTRLQDDPYQDQASLAETRLQLSLERPGRRADLKLTADFLYDDLARSHAVDLENGQGFVDLREASVLLRAGVDFDVKLGRQILTWGTGDLIFINDLFPKDYPAFFLGREEDYLKAPSDAVKLSFFSEAVNLDLAYTPGFDANRYVDGNRLSFYNSPLGRRSGQDAPVDANRPDTWFEDDELALRLYSNLSGYEIAVYGYSGFWKDPVGMDPQSGTATFPSLGVYGASVLGPLWGGIANLEIGYYDSQDDRDGDNPNLPNSEARLLAGYQRELYPEFNLGVQYYLEHMMDYDAYRGGLAPGSLARDENRHLLTLRLTRLLMRQDLKLSLFVYYSPSDEDGYVRLNTRYRLDDHWVVDVGANGFFGEREHTFFGQFEDNSNIYLGIRYNFDAGALLKQNGT